MEACWCVCSSTCCGRAVVDREPELINCRIPPAAGQLLKLTIPKLACTPATTLPLQLALPSHAEPAACDGELATLWAVAGTLPAICKPRAVKTGQS